MVFSLNPHGAHAHFLHNALAGVEATATPTKGVCELPLVHLTNKHSKHVPCVTAHQNYTLTSTRDNSTTMANIEAALKAIESLGPREQLSYRKIAGEYGCSYTTLRRRHQGLATSRATQDSNQQTLHPQQELELLRYIERLTRQGLPPTRAMIRTFASQIAQREVEIHWVDRFVQRHPDEVIFK